MSTLAEHTVRITTNNRTRPLLSLVQVPAEVRESQFGYVADTDDNEEAYTPRFFQFRGEWHDSNEFERSANSIAAQGYDGQQVTSAWDAIVLRYFDRDGYELDGVVVGHAVWA